MPATLPSESSFISRQENPKGVQQHALFLLAYRFHCHHREAGLQPALTTSCTQLPQYQLQYPSGNSSNAKKYSATPKTLDHEIIDPPLGHRHLHTAIPHALRPRKNIQHPIPSSSSGDHRNDRDSIHQWRLSPFDGLLTESRGWLVPSCGFFRMRNRCNCSMGRKAMDGYVCSPQTVGFRA